VGRVLFQWLTMPATARVVRYSLLLVAPWALSAPFSEASAVPKWPDKLGLPLPWNTAALSVCTALCTLYFVHMYAYYSHTYC